MLPIRMTRIRHLQLRFFCITLCLAGLLGSSALCEDRASSDASDETTGTVEGIVTYQADSSRPWRYARYYVKGGKSGALAEAVVALHGSEPSGDVEKGGPATVVIDQKDFRFIPETVAIRTGDRVKFKNSDGAIHNVFVPNPGNQFNVNMPAGGRTHRDV